MHTDVRCESIARDARTALTKMITDLMDIITGTEMIIDSDGYDYGKYSFFKQPYINVGTNEENIIENFVFFLSKEESDLQTGSDQKVPALTGSGFATLLRGVIDTSESQDSAVLMTSEGEAPHVWSKQV